MGSWETHIQGAALVAGEDLPHALAHALGAPQLGFLSRPLHRGSERGGVDLGRHGYESRVVAALRVSRRRVAAADADAAECLSPRDSPPLTARPATMHDTRRGREYHLFKGAPVTAGAPRRRGLASSFVNALCFLQSAKDQIIGSVGPFLRDAKPRLGVNPARRTRALNRRDRRETFAKKTLLLLHSQLYTRRSARRIKPRPPPTRRRSR